MLKGLSSFRSLRKERGTSAEMDQQEVKTSLSCKTSGRESWSILSPDCLSWQGKDRYKGLGFGWPDFFFLLTFDQMSIAWVDINKVRICELTRELIAQEQREKLIIPNLLTTMILAFVILTFATRLFALDSFI